MNSHNLVSPFLGQGHPVYPHLMQSLRLTGGTLLGPAGQTIYVAHVQQLDSSTLLMRDREACFVIDINGNDLSTASYIGRLVGSYLSYPVYVTYCCTTTSESGTGSGDGCCIPGTLCATFGGALADLGSITLLPSGGSSYFSYVAVTTSCYPTGTVHVSAVLLCSGGVWSMGLYIIRDGYDGETLVNFDGVSFNCNTLSGSGSGVVNPVYNHGGTGTPCTGMTATVTLLSGTCDGTGSGTGSGPSDLHPTSCCLDGLATTLYLVLSGTDDCSCVSGTYAVTWDGTGWSSIGLTLCLHTGDLQLVCSVSGWNVVLNCNGTITSSSPVANSCTLPLDLGTVSSGTCCTGSISITLTE